MKLRLCKIQGCNETRLGRSCFCRQHHREYCRTYYRHKKAEHEVWFEKNRHWQFRKLIAVSSPADKKVIEQGRREGRVLRKVAESL